MCANRDFTVRVCRGDGVDLEISAAPRLAIAAVSYWDGVGGRLVLSCCRFSGEIRPQGASENLRKQARKQATVDGPYRQEKLSMCTSPSPPAPLRHVDHCIAGGCCSNVPPGEAMGESEHGSMSARVGFALFAVAGVVWAAMFGTGFVGMTHGGLDYACFMSGPYPNDVDAANLPMAVTGEVSWWPLGRSCDWDGGSGAKPVHADPKWFFTGSTLALGALTVSGLLTWVAGAHRNRGRSSATGATSSKS